MSFRRKIFLICLALLITAAVLAVGSFHVFLGMGKQMERLQVSIGAGVDHIDLMVSMDKPSLLTETWMKTGDIKYKNEALEVLDHNLELINTLRLSVSDEAGFDVLSSYILEIKAVLLSISDVPGGLELAGRADEISSLFAHSFVEADAINLSLVAESAHSVEVSRKYKSRIYSLMVALVVTCVVIVGTLIVMVGRTMDEPYSKLLEATEHVAAGDLLYRIKENDKDSEFGLIASRFNQMVGNLQRANIDLHDKVWQTELLLEASRLSENLEDMAPAMEQLVRSIAGKLGYDVCIVLRYDETTESLKVLASSTGEYYHGDPVSFGQDATARLLNSPGPIRIYAEGGADALLDKMHDSDVLLVPITAEQGVSVGLIAMFGGSPDLDADYNDTFMLLSTIVGTAIRSADLHGETTTSLRQLALINDLGRAITSVYDPKELIESLATRIAGLTNAKRCLIRIIEGGELKAVSSFGPLDKMALQNDIPLGKGMAGWVAKEGKPLLVVDTKSLPVEMNYPPTTSQTAISVPLVKEGKTIGVLGIYDKYDEQEQIVPFAKDDLLLAEGLASITAVALERSFIQEKHEKVMLAKERSEKKFDLLFESVQGGIVTLDRDFNITTANKFIERWCDKPLNEIVGKSALDVFHSKEGICPHCAATGTFEDGGINSITQSFGLNYAELSSYPSFDENGAVTEAVVFIQDITDRVLYQEEIMGLYREVVQNKEYIESLISNSADAIITTDLEGNVKSWNPSAEVIYGYTKEEVDGKPIPYVPDDLKGVEHYNWEKIRGGDVVNIEIFRVRRDGTLIDTSLTMSPIKDATGDVIGMSSIS
ncbi:MAG TPA: PAS domain S-box protein, partial [Nitrospirae bacterium]|nr:PAS domain S-box protein [Nitrospirota bacterium]